VNRSYSKIRHIQESNIVLENRLLFKKILIESENKLLYDTELCETIKDQYGFNSENQLIKWYDSHKDKDTLAWFFKNPDPRIKKHLDHINTKCVGNDVELKSSIVGWWFNLATMYCNDMDETYGRYYRELNRDPKVVMGCQSSEMIQNDNIKFPRRDGF
jgi:hypothetical protein